MKLRYLCLLITLAFSSISFAESITNTVKSDESRLINIFKHLHANPELGFQEFETAKFLADELKQNGFKVHQGIGGTGVAGILRNGKGPTIMLRADMDALPIKEEADLPYRSKAIKKDREGNEFPVMHACGHDAHVTWLIGVAKELATRKKQWSGTVVLIGQPAEELIEGAQAMLDDGLYKLVPKPDIIIAGHNYPTYPAGSVGIGNGRRMAGTDQLDVKIYGVGGHGSMPNGSKDPVVMGAMATLGYQAVRGRVLDQYQPAVLTVGAFQAGTSNNIIPDYATLKLNLRWYRDAEREAMINGIKSVTDNVANMYDMPKERMPTYLMKGYSTPVFNAEVDYKRAKKAIGKTLGQDNVYEGLPPVMGSEDFQMLATPFDDVPVLFIEVGSGAKDAYSNIIKHGKLPNVLNHNPKYVVDIKAISTGTVALTSVALEYLDNN